VKRSRRPSRVCLFEYMWILYIRFTLLQLMSFFSIGNRKCSVDHGAIVFLLESVAVGSDKFRTGSAVVAPVHVAAWGQSSFAVLRAETLDCLLHRHNMFNLFEAIIQSGDRGAFEHVIATMAIKMPRPLMINKQRIDVWADQAFAK
jgi:hypothetical protein